jgi:fructose transport system permease protein
MRSQGDIMATHAPAPTPTEPAPSAPDPAHAFIDRRTPIARIRGVLHRYPAISPGVVLVAAILAFGALNPHFLAPSNLSLITQQVAVIGILGVAETLVILTAGIDLSVGAAMVLSSVVVGNTVVGLHFPAPSPCSPAWRPACSPAPSTAFSSRGLHCRRSS